MDENAIIKINWQDKILLWMLRAITPVIAGVSKSLGLVKYGMKVMSTVALATTQGTAKLTFYRSSGSKSDMLPLYINHHGGGFVVGYARQDDMICRYLAWHAKCIVVNVDYVLAPEHPYPAQVLQCLEIAEWLKKNARQLNINSDRIAIGGQSAGASISAAVCLMAKDRGQSLFCAQILNYGYFNTEESSFDKFIKSGKSQALTPKLLAFFQKLYLPYTEKRREQFASPMLAPDLTGLPDALVITAGHDLMKNDGNQYAERLQTNGVSVIHREYPNADHGFIHNGPSDATHAVLKLMVEVLTHKFYKS